MPQNTRILQYKFADSRQSLYGSVYFHFAMALFFWIGGYPHFEFSERALITLGVGFISLLLIEYYSWKNTRLNLLILLAYLLTILLEFLILGFPHSDHKISTHSSYLAGKGSITDMFIGLMPFVYIGLRFVFALPIIMVVKHSENLNNAEPT